MQPFKIVIMAVCLLCIIGGAVLIADAATTFSGSTIVGVDQAKRMVTFQTKEGLTWRLPVRDPNLLHTEQLTEGDRVSIEVDQSDRIFWITKVAKQPREDPLSELLKPLYDAY